MPRNGHGPDRHLGAARIAPAAVIKPARAVSEAEIGAVAARDRSRADAFAAKHGIPNVHDSYAACSPIPTSTRSTTHCPTVCTPSGPSPRSRRASTCSARSRSPRTRRRPRRGRGRGPHRARGDGGVPLPLPPARAPHARRSSRAASWARSERVETALCFPLPKFSDIRYQYDLAGGATMDVGAYTVHLARLLGCEEPTVVSAERQAAHPRRRSCHARRAGVPERPHRPDHVLDVVEVACIQTYARVIGDRGEIHVINPTTRRSWHRMRVKIDGTHPHRAVLAPTDLRVPTRRVLRGRAPRRADADPSGRLDRQHACARRDLCRRRDEAARNVTDPV